MTMIYCYNAMRCVIILSIEYHGSCIERRASSIEYWVFSALTLEYWPWITDLGVLTSEYCWSTWSTDIWVQLTLNHWPCSTDLGVLEYWPLSTVDLGSLTLQYWPWSTGVDLWVQLTLDHWPCSTDLGVLEYWPLSIVAALASACCGTDSGRRPSRPTPHRRRTDVAPPPPRTPASPSARWASAARWSVRASSSPRRADTSQPSPARRTRWRRETPRRAPCGPHTATDRTDRRTDGRAGPGHTDRVTDRQTGWQTDRRSGRTWTHGQGDRQTDRVTDRQTVRQDLDTRTGWQTDRQTDRVTDRQPSRQDLDTDRVTDRQTVRQDLDTDRVTDRQPSRQDLDTDRVTDRQLSVYICYLRLDEAVSGRRPDADRRRLIGQHRLAGVQPAHPGGGVEKRRSASERQAVAFEDDLGGRGGDDKVGQLHRPVCRTSQGSRENILWKYFVKIFCENIFVKIFCENILWK